jgi:hypothetical protein
MLAIVDRRGDAKPDPMVAALTQGIATVTSLGGRGALTSVLPIERPGPSAASVQRLMRTSSAFRVIDVARRCVTTIAGMAGWDTRAMDGDARYARFHSNPHAKFDDPISLPLERGKKRVHR